MLSKNDKLELETLKLQSFARPPLKAGEYTLKTELKTKTTGADAKIPASIAGPEVKFTIDAPRLSIDTELIHSAYPLAGSSGDFQQSLPHVIIKRKTLPWERSGGKKAEDDTPWLCILLLNEEEAGPDLVQQISASKFLVASDSIAVPAITLTHKETLLGSKMKVIEIDINLFKTIVPKLDEVDLLVHTRQVDTSNKANDEDNEKGKFSTIVGNRIPGKGQTNHAFLISIEGCSDYISEPATANDKRKIRLAVLHNWQFTDMGMKFDAVVEQLNKNAKPLSMDMEDKVLQGGIGNAIGYGYAPLNHTRRNNKKAVSWYRGPFIPLDIPKPYVHVYNNADEALRFDKETGLFDISYASAFQLGRLLALQDSGFSKAISNWKNAYKRDAPIDVAKNILKAEKAIDLKTEDVDGIIDDIQADDVLTDYLIELWGKSIKG